MQRIRGTFNEKNNYEVIAKRPYDARMLVPTYADLTLKDNWLELDPETGELTTTLIAFNGLIVAVADQTDPEHSGIYMMYDRTAKKNVNVESEENWIKIGETSDVSDFANRLTAIESELVSIDTRLTALESEEKVHTYANRNSFPEQAQAVPGHMYVAADLKRTYVYVDGTGYVIVGAGFEESKEGDLLINGGTADNLV